MPLATIGTLLTHPDASIRYQTETRILGADPAAPEMQALQSAIKKAPSVQTLLKERVADGTIPRHPYSKWWGAHWVLAQLADLHYPPGDASLIPLREQALDWLFSENHQKDFKPRTVAGKVRMHPSQEGNAIYYLVKLGLADQRVDQLVERMLSWRWPDGGWNCDIKPHVQISSFTETLIPLRGLAHYQQYRSDSSIQALLPEVAEIFLKRQLFRRESNTNIMKSDFIKLHYPCYWHYDILFALKVLHEAVLLTDPRTAAALDRLQSKQLPDGGFPAEAKYYRVATNTCHDWGGTSKLHSNPWVTVDALAVLQAAGRLTLAAQQ